MKVIKILNNNVVLVQRGGNEVIVVSKGIGLKKKKGQTITEEEIEKIYILDSYDMLDHFSYLLSKSDPEDIMLVQKIISYAEKELGFKAGDYLTLTLLDHLEFLLERVLKQQFIKSPLLWDVKRFYPQYYQVGLDSLKMIMDQKKVELPEAEVVSLTLHFINMNEAKGDQVNRAKEIRTISDIISIIEVGFKLKLDETSINYMRFFTHLQYFVQRVLDKQLHVSSEDSLILYRQVSQTYPKEFEIVQKIKIYIMSQFKSEISEEEETYLMIHIHRVTERIKK